MRKAIKSNIGRDSFGKLRNFTREENPFFSMKRANCYESRNFPLKLSPSSKERSKGVPFGIPDNSGFREDFLRDWDGFRKRLFQRFSW